MKIHVVVIESIPFSRMFMFQASEISISSRISFRRVLTCFSRPQFRSQPFRTFMNLRTQECCISLWFTIIFIVFCIICSAIKAFSWLNWLRKTIFLHSILSISFLAYISYFWSRERTLCVIFSTSSWHFCLFKLCAKLSIIRGVELLNSSLNWAKTFRRKRFSWK